MAQTHFLADLHLTDDSEPAAQRLAAYLAGPALQADAVYILGDLFEVWVGDDGSIADHRHILACFAELVYRHDTPVYFMRGNRDFGVGSHFEETSGMQIIPDPLVIDLYGCPSLLTHGDSLCTDDSRHQAFRAKYTDPNWRARMLKLPLWLRRCLARRARQRSQRHKARQSAAIMDVNDQTVRWIFNQYQVNRIIHGHTHRPADHSLIVSSDEAPRWRLVLADWRPEQHEYLCVSPTGVTRHSI